MTSVNGQEPAAGVDVACLRELVETVDQVLFLIAADLSRMFYISPSFETITGNSCENVYQNPRSWTELICDEDRARVLNAVAKRASGELRGRSELEFRFKAANGDVRWMRSVITPVRDESGRIDRLAGVLEDINARKESELKLKEVQGDLAREVDRRTRELTATVGRLQTEIEQRKQVEAELRRSEIRMRKLFEANIVGVIFSDIYGNIFDANEAFLTMTGYSRADLPMRWDKMTPREWLHISELAVHQVVREGNVPPWEKEYFRKDGTRVPVLIGNALLDRETMLCASFVVDLTSRKIAEEQVREVNLQLEHASRLSAMGELLADLTHEIHQPLGVIANYANGTLRRMKTKQLSIGDLKERLEEIAAESMRVAEVLRRIREFVSRRDPERKSISLNTVILDALQFTRLERKEHDVQVFFRPDDELPPVHADRVQLTQVLVNLVLNSVAAVASNDGKAGRILISSYINDAGLAEMSIADNGRGVAETDVPRIFDRFFTTKSGGLGLGLPISRSIIESHGGQLWYAADPGEPAVFRLTLPLQHGPTPPST